MTFNFTKKHNLLKQFTVSLIAYLFLLNTNAFAQAPAWQWARSGGGVSAEGANSTCVDAAGNVFVAGYFNSNSISIGTITLVNAGLTGSDGFVAKYTAAGVPVWAIRIGGTGTDGVSGISCDAAGNVYVAGQFNSPLIALSSLTYSNPGAPNYDIYAACISNAGVPVWLRAYGGTGNEYCGGAVYSNTASALYISGTFYNSVTTISTATLNNTSLTGRPDALLFKVNTGGTFQWARSTGGANTDDFGGRVDADNIGSVYFCGNYSGSVTTPTTVIGTTTLTSVGQKDLFLAKYNTAGTFIWARGMGSSTSGDFNGGIVVDKATNDVYISGYYQNATMVVNTTSLTSIGGYDSFLAKYGQTGAFQWANKLGSTTDDYNWNISIDASGNPYMLGSFTGTTMTAGTVTLTNSSPGSTMDAYIVKYNPSGAAQWGTQAKSAGLDEYAYDLAADAVGNLYVVGNINGTTSFSNIHTVNSVGGSDYFLSKIGCLTAGIIGVSSVCEGNSTMLSGAGATTYTWSTGATGSNIVVTPTATTIYTVTGSTGGCIGTVGSITISVIPATLNVGANLNLTCKQKSVITASCSPSATLVAWTPTTGLSSSSVLTPTVTGNFGTTIYTVNVNLSNGCNRTSTLGVTAAAQAPNICMVSVDSLGVNNEIFWDKTLYPRADSFIVYRETSLNFYTRIGAVSRTALSMYVDTNRSIGPANGNPNLSYYKYKLRIKDSCGNVSPLSLWHETIFIQDQLNGNFNWNSYAIESSVPPISIYNLKRRNIATGTETLVLATVGNLGTDPLYNTFWPTATKWFVDAIGFSCNATAKVMVLKTKTKSNQSNDKTFPTGINSVSLNTAVSVYPNPAQDVLNVDMNALPKTETIVELQNMLGETIYTTTSLNQHLVINTSAFAKGVYLLNIKQNSKTIAIKKVVVE